MSPTEQTIALPNGVSLQSFRLVADLMPQLMWCISADGSLAYYNKRRSDYNGSGGDNGFGWQPTMHPDDREATLAAFTAARGNSSEEPQYEMQHRLQLADGTYKWHLTRATGVRGAGGQIAAWYGTATNIQDAPLAVQTERLARVEAERLVSFAQVFSGILGHDLRNPLSAIKMGGQMLLSTQAAPNERTQRIAGRVVNSADRMARMIQQLLDFTRLRLGVGLELEKTTCDVGEILVAVADEARSANNGRQIDVVRSGDLSGAWDRERLAQVITNLVSNAVLHGDESAPVSVALTGVAPSEVIVEVKNAGAIPEDAVPNLAKPVRRGSSSAKGGLGIGLYIADELVRLHNGALTFTSNAEQGTCFKVVLPR